MGRTRWTHPTNPNLTGVIVNKGGKPFIQWFDHKGPVSRIPLMDMVDEFENLGVPCEVTHELARAIEQYEADVEKQSKGRRL